MSAMPRQWIETETGLNHELNGAATPGRLMPRRTSPPAANRKLNQLGTELRRLREAERMLQTELAVKLQKAGWDIELATLNRIESGARALTDVGLLLILKLLGKRLGDLDRVR